MITAETKVKTHPLMIFKFTRRYVFILLLPLVRSILNYGVTGALSRLVIMESLLAFLILVVSVMRWLSFSVVFRDDCIIVDSGVLVRRHAVMPLEKISISYTERNLLLGFFGAVAARIDTDSGFRKKADFEIYFSRKAARVYETLIQPENSGVLSYHSKLSMGIVMALANASAFTGLIVLAPAINRAGEILGDRINSGLRDTISFATALIGTIVPPAATVIAIIFVAGFAVSFLLTFIRYIPFRLLESDNKITAEHGFLARHRAVINRESINAVVINMPPVMRVLGFCWVGISAAGYGKKREESEVVLPAVNLRQANDFQLGIFDISSEDKFDLTCPRRMLKRAVFMPLVLIAVSIAVELVLMAIFNAFSGMIALIMSFIQIVLLYLLSVRIYHQNHGGVTISDGVIMRSYKRLTIKKMRVKKDKTCMLKVSQGPLERRYGACKLAVTVRAEQPITLKATNLDKNETDRLIKRYFKA